MKKSNFWEGFYKALNAEYKDVKELKGISGITHRINSIGINHDEKKIIIAQNEQDARILAMAQADIQARMKGYNILMVRPVPINLSRVFTHLSLLMGKNVMSLKELSAKGDESEENIESKYKSNIEKVVNDINPQIALIEKTSLSLVPIFKEVVHQLSHLKFIQNMEDSDSKDFNLDFGELLNFNPLIYDTGSGVCPLPFYNFTEEEAESFLSQKDLERNIEILKRHNIYQYFNPPPDSLALGLIEEGNKNEVKIIETIKDVPAIGHPFGDNEIIDTKKIDEIVEALKDKGLAVEGEFGVSISDEGIEKRAVVKFSPRESIFKRISNMISFKVDLNLKDLKDIIGK